MSAKSESSRYQQPGGPAPWLFGIWGLISLAWFGFAFAPNDENRSWLHTAQVICFGSSDNGLPSDWGLVILILAPMSMLAGLAAVYGFELFEWALRRRRVALFLFFGFGLASLVELRWVIQRVIDARSLSGSYAAARLPAMPDNYPLSQDPFPAFSLADAFGHTIHADDLRGAPTIVSFVYASCATVCPFMIRDALQAAAAVAGSRTLFITLDPWRDTPLALPGIRARYAMPDSSRLLSGDPSAVAALLKRLGISQLRDPLTGEINHTPLVLVLDRQGRIAYRFQRPSSEWLVMALERLRMKG